MAITDDAYFGLFYEDSMTESLFGKLANLHPRILAIKLDGATKEEYVWGFRTGFITFADGNAEANPKVLTALEKKTMGIIRATISNCPHPGQTFVLEALRSPDFVAPKESRGPGARERRPPKRKNLKGPPRMQARRATMMPWIFSRDGKSDLRELGISLHNVKVVTTRFFH